MGIYTRSRHYLSHTAPVYPQSTYRGLVTTNGKHNTKEWVLPVVCSQFTDFQQILVLCKIQAVGCTSPASLSHSQSCPACPRIKVGGGETGASAQSVPVYTFFFPEVLSFLQSPDLLQPARPVTTD